MIDTLAACLMSMNFETKRVDDTLYLRCYEATTALCAAVLLTQDFKSLRMIDKDSPEVETCFKDVLSYAVILSGQRMCSYNSQNTEHCELIGKTLDVGTFCSWDTTVIAGATYHYVDWVYSNGSPARGWAKCDLIQGTK